MNWPSVNAASLSVLLRMPQVAVATNSTRLASTAFRYARWRASGLTPVHGRERLRFVERLQRGEMISAAAVVLAPHAAAIHQAGIEPAKGLHRMHVDMIAV